MMFGGLALQVAFPEVYYGLFIGAIGLCRLVYLTGYERGTRDQRMMDEAYSEAKRCQEAADYYETSGTS